MFPLLGPSGKIGKVIIVAALILSLGVLAAVFLRGALTDGANQADNVAVPGASTPTSAAPPAEPTLASPSPVSRSEDDSDGLTGKVLVPNNDFQEKARRTWSLAESRALQQEYWRKEDAVLSKAPEYSDVEDAVQAKAAQMLTSVNMDDTKAVLRLAQDELDRFWDAGSLAEPSAYEHAYVARAILETVLERQRENFELLCGLKEAVSAVSPLIFGDMSASLRNEAMIRRYHASQLTLWEISDRQRNLILAGKAPLSADAMLAMFDWAQLTVTGKGSIKESVPAYQWLVDNAEAGGWVAKKPFFQKALELARENKGAGTRFFSYNDVSDRKKYLIITAINGRRLDSTRGSKEYREKCKPTWLTARPDQDSSLNPQTR